MGKIIQFPGTEAPKAEPRRGGMRIITKASQQIDDDMSWDFLQRVQGAEYHAGTKKTSIQFYHNSMKYNVPPTYALLSIAMHAMARHSEDKNAQLLNTGYIQLNYNEDGELEETRILKKLTHGLFAQDADVQKISHGGIRSIFRNYNLDVMVNHFLNDCKYREDIVYLSLKARFEPTTDAIGNYTEDEVRAINEEIYKDLKNEMEEKAGGKLVWNRMYLSVLGQQVGNELAKRTGWKFKYREVEDINFDEEMIAIFRLAYPHFAAAVDETITLLETGKEKSVAYRGENPIEQLAFRKDQYKDETKAMIDMMGEYTEEITCGDPHKYYTSMAIGFCEKYFTLMGKDIDDPRIRSMIIRNANEIAAYIIVRLGKYKT